MCVFRFSISYSEVFHLIRTCTGLERMKKRTLFGRESGFRSYVSGPCGSRFRGSLPRQRSGGFAQNRFELGSDFCWDVSPSATGSVPMGAQCLLLLKFVDDPSQHVRECPGGRVCASEAARSGPGARGGLRPDPEHALPLHRREPGAQRQLVQGVRDGHVHQRLRLQRRARPGAASWLCRCQMLL